MLCSLDVSNRSLGYDPHLWEHLGLYEGGQVAAESNGVAHDE